MQHFKRPIIQEVEINGECKDRVLGAKIHILIRILLCGVQSCNMLWTGDRSAFLNTAPW